MNPFRKRPEQSVPLVAESIPTIAAAASPYSRPGFSGAKLVSLLEDPGRANNPFTIARDQPV